MKIRKFLMTCVIAGSLVSLGACGATESTQSVGGKQSGSTQSGTTQQSNGSSATNSNQSGSAKQSGGSTQQSSGSTQSSGDSSSSGTPSDSTGSMGGSVGASGGESSIGNSSTSSSASGESSTTPATPPKTKQESLKAIKNTITTRVPLMLPNDVPYAQDAYLSATTHSETWFYSANLTETPEPAQINSSTAASGRQIVQVQGTEYATSKQATNNISGYVKVNPSGGPVTVDLGHGIKGVEEGAVGHDYIMWNEGNWSIKINSPNDPTYKTKEFPDSHLLAQKIVTILNTYYLPAPHDMGVITTTGKTIIKQL